MGCNVGNTERIVRIVIGALLLAVGAVSDLPTWGTWAFYAVGIIALVTGAVGFCPAWKLFGMNTCS